ncbi:MAG: V-type ATP synthase subunit F [Clostridiales bacterium]|nr:V-type ATP synthase subunit F [Clostridiales bacterium]
MYKIAVVGDRDSVIGFKALGLDTFETDQPEMAESILRDLADREYAIVYITEQLAQQMMDVIHQYQSQVTPAVILIPGKEGTLGIGQVALKTAVEKAVGADILG